MGSGKEKVAAMGALAIFGPAGGLLRHTLDLMHRKSLTIDTACFQSSAQDRHSVIKSWPDRLQREPYRSVSGDGQWPVKDCQADDFRAPNMRTSG